MPSHNRLAQLFEDEAVAIGASSGLHSETSVELLGEVGVDFVFADFEHSGPSIWNGKRLEGLTRAADIGNIELMVQLPSAERGTPDSGPMVRKVLDTGVQTVVLPRVERRSEVQQFVEACQFSVDGGPGQRGVGVARGSQWGSDIGQD